MSSDTGDRDMWTEPTGDWTHREEQLAKRARTVLSAKPHSEDGVLLLMVLEKPGHLLRCHLFKEISEIILKATVRVVGGFDDAVDIASECESKLFYVESPGHVGWIEQYLEHLEHDIKFNKSLKEYLYTKVKKHIQKDRKRSRFRAKLVEEKAAHIVGDAQVELPSSDGWMRTGHALWSRCEPDPEEKYEAKEIFDMIVAGSSSAPSKLTGREKQVVMKIVRGESRKAISKDLGVSRESVRRDIESVLSKIGILSTMFLVYSSLISHAPIPTKRHVSSSFHRWYSSSFSSVSSQGV